MTKSKTATPWYTIKRWARQGDWETECCAPDHMSFVKGSDMIEVVLETGRMVKAEFHRHGMNDECQILKQAYTSHLSVSIKDWFA